MVDTPAAPQPEYLLNASGETYGSAQYAQPGQEPDLILVVGDQGRTGYVTAEDFAGPEVSNPEEASRYMESDYARNGVVVPVYAADGTTQIDVFTISAAVEAE